jgi:hypothetical protein
MEKQRTQPWAQMVPGLASTLQHLDSSVATLSATVQRTNLQQQQQQQEQPQGAIAANSAATPAAGTAALSPSKRSTATAMPKLYSLKDGGHCAGGLSGVLVGPGIWHGAGAGVGLVPAAVVAEDMQYKPTRVGSAWVGV